MARPGGGGPAYAGPVIDAHHHLWEYGSGRYPWLAPGGGPASLGDLAYLRADYLPDDFARDCAGQDLVGSVVVEALWDPARDPYEEMEWLDTLPRVGGIAARYVAFADLVAPGAAARVARLAGHPRIAGVRQTLRWHPDPARRWSDRRLTDDPAWRRGIGLVGDAGLVLEVLTYPWQAGEVARLAHDMPGLTVVVNHCSSPIDRDAAGIERWRQGLEVLAAAPNVHLKLSNFVGYVTGPTVEAARAVLLPCIEAFGAGRCLFGSDFPVARRTMPYAEMCGLFRAAVADLPLAEQRELLFGTAARLYRLSAQDDGPV